MSYPVHIYVAPDGSWSGARNRKPSAVSIGLWWPSQFRYRPFAEAVSEAAARAAQPAVEQRGQYTAEQFERLPIARSKRAAPQLREAARLHLVEDLSISEACRRAGSTQPNLSDALAAMRRRLADMESQ